MLSIEHFEVKNKRFFLLLNEVGTESNEARNGLVTVGEIHIDKRKYFICEELPAKAESKKDAPGLASSLTRRELQIVVMVSDGLVNKVIADRLNISEWTVSTHLRRIFAKLRVDSRAEMVYRCARLIDSHKS